MKAWWVLIFVWVLWGVSPQVGAYDYGPACQWFRFHGQVVGAPPDANLRLTLSYQTPDKKQAVRLLNRYPLSSANFYFVFSGFWGRWGETIFFPFLLPSSRTIDFFYSVSSSKGDWASPLYRVRFSPVHLPRVSIPANRDQEYLCHTAISLGTMVLEARPTRAARR